MKWILLLVAGLQAVAGTPIDFDLTTFHGNSATELDLLDQLDVEELSLTLLDGYGDLPLKTFFNIKSWNAIEERSELPQCKQFIDDKVKVYHSIDPSRAMKDLAEVGSLLRLAYSGAKGYPCSTPILAVTSGYQDLIKDSLVVASTFVEVVLKALKYHKYSIMFAEKKRMELSLKYLKKCSIMAARMAVESQKLVDRSDELIGLAVDALLSANNDYNGSKNETRRIEEMIKKIKLEQAKQEEIKKDLDKMVEEEEKREKENSAIAEESSGLGMIIKTLSLGIINPDAGKQEAAKKAAEEARKARIAYQQQQKENNMNLKRSVEKLMEATKTKERLDKAVLGLDVTIQTMGQVKTIFSNAKIFWVGIKKHVDSLSATHQQLEDLANDEEFHEEYTHEVGNSGFSWLAIGKICRMAALAIREVDKGVDEVMKKIPTEKEAKALIESLGKDILEGIDEDNEEIEKELESEKNQPKMLNWRW